MGRWDPSLAVVTSHNEVSSTLRRTSDGAAILLHFVPSRIKMERLTMCSRPRREELRRKNTRERMRAFRAREAAQLAKMEHPYLKRTAVYYTHRLHLLKMFQLRKRAHEEKTEQSRVEAQNTTTGQRSIKERFPDEQQSDSVLPASSPSPISLDQLPLSTSTHSSTPASPFVRIKCEPIDSSSCVSDITSVHQSSSAVIPSPDSFPLNKDNRAPALPALSTSPLPFQNVPPPPSASLTSDAIGEQSSSRTEREELRKRKNDRMKAWRASRSPNSREKHLAERRSRYAARMAVVRAHESEEDAAKRRAVNAARMAALRARETAEAKAARRARAAARRSDKRAQETEEEAAARRATRRSRRKKKIATVNIDDVLQKLVEHEKESKTNVVPMLHHEFKETDHSDSSQLSDIPAKSVLALMDEIANIAHPYGDVYEALYREVNPGNVPTISAGDAAAFLKRSNLNVQVLGQIWEIADYQRRGVLDRRGIYMALKLVAAAQQGHPLATASLYTAGLQPPSFASRTATPSIPNLGQQQSPSQAMARQWAIDVNDQAKYDSIFDSLSPVDGKLPGAKVRPVLLNSGLNPNSLAKIWELADQDKDGQLDRVEMTVALHLVYRALQNEPVPSFLPASLIHPTKAHLSRRTSVSSQGGQAFGGFGGMNSSVRSRTGSMASLDGIGMGSMGGGMVMPLATDRSMSAQPMGNYNGSVPSTPGGPSSPSLGGGFNTSVSSSDWPVNKFVCAAQFASCDADRDGLVGGQDVRQVLVASGLPQQSLAHIWELADVNKNGTLNHEQFALILHLVQMAKRGEQLPVSLPAYLMPPSLRQLNLNLSSEAGAQQENGGVETPSADIVSSISSTALGQAAQSDNPEVRQLAEEMEKLLTERREADAQVVQLEADMTVKNSAIKNLQIELQTLESTVKQLERQKSEANRRLGDLDEQIRQLEAAGAAQEAKGVDTQARLEQLQADTEQGAASAERDQTAIAEARSELSQLEAEGRGLANQLAEEKRSFETAVDDITKAERDTERDSKQLAELQAETERVRQAMEQLKSISESENTLEQLKEKPQLMGGFENPNLFHDAPIGVASTSSQNSFQQPPDPFAAQQQQLQNAAMARQGLASNTVDPFAQTDPFAAAPAAGGVFAGGFPADPFAGASVGGFGGANGDAGGPSPFANEPSAAATSKAPPPRPAPPKATGSARNTPVNTEDPFGNVDPFAGQPTSTANGGSGGFADFASFGAFGN